MTKAPLQGRYPASVATALLALTPFLVATTAGRSLQRQVLDVTGLSATGFALIDGLAVAAYAFGAMLAADLFQRLPLKGFFLALEGAFVGASVLTALAPGPVAFGAGRMVQGVCTGMLLVVALPPVIQQYGRDKLPLSAVAINVGLFGAVTVGPVVGGVFAETLGFRWFYGLLGAVAGAGFLLGAVSLDRQKAKNPDQPRNLVAIGLALLATTLPFTGVAALTGQPLAAVRIWAPVGVGLAALTALIVSQYRQETPLVPVGPLASTLPVSGTVAACVGGAGFVALLDLAEVYLERVAEQSPLMLGVSTLPMVGGLVLAAVLFGPLLSSRWLPAYAGTGLVALLAAGGLLLVPDAGGGGAAVLAAIGLLGYGAGASVAPGLFLAAFGVPSKQLGRTFALVELLRSEAAFLIAPLLLHLAVFQATPDALPGRIGTAVLVSLTLTGVGVLVVAGLYLSGRPRMHAPDLTAWLGGDAQALNSPKLARLLREEPYPDEQRVGDRERR